ncbi:helix-turn-helix domain-containing protein [Vibrio makurazakiensis]|uniref:helix-turn-helix domain-containing protein n=1 Tax=Vibrio makurazakiensis TaxID=2910250 RepID=UPI003D0DF2C3
MRQNYVVVLTLWVLSFNVFALNSSSSVFYPLPMHAQGKFLAAKDIFVGINGGLWVHDVHGNIVFYDGRVLLPKKGSLLDFPSEQLAFADNKFWTYFDNEVYENTPGIGRSLAFSLNPGSEITNIGSSGDYVWVTDDTNFYTFNVVNHEFSTYSLLELYRHNKASSIKVNDAERVLTKWVLATTAGTYLSSDEEFTHIRSSGKNYSEELYFSKTRRELIIGTLDGAVVIDITNPSSISKRIGTSHVLALEETTTGYWVGTEHGLYNYDFLSGEVSKIDKNGNDKFSLPGDKIYSIKNTRFGGVWVATNNGIRYFSLFSKSFGRNSLSGNDMHVSKAVITKVKAKDSDGYWASSTSGLYYMSNDHSIEPKLVYSGKISDFLIVENKLILATDEGLVCVNILNHEFEQLPVPMVLQGLSVEHLALTGGNVVWLTSGNSLFSYDLSTDNVEKFGSSWLVGKYLPTKITELEGTQEDNVLIGTDHGHYSFVGDKISFNRNSERFGKTIDIAIARDGSQWFASSYGVYRVDTGSKDVIEVPLIEENISSKCLMPVKGGVWVGSSKGLSFHDNFGKLQKHFGSLSGLIDNELSAGSCSVSDDDQDVLLLGSKYGTLIAKSDALLVADTPQNFAIFSRVTVDQKTVFLGGTEDALKPFPYGSSIGFKVGIVPMAQSSELEYRLNSDESWNVFEGGLLTFEHLPPGEYNLEVRSSSNSYTIFMGAEQAFIVAKPWFLTKWAAATLLLVTVALITLIVLWRSRFMARANQQLKAQVALKTDQLRHQSRVLLTTNQQLRKQLQVKSVVVEHKAAELEDNLSSILLNLPNWQNSQATPFIAQLHSGFALLKNSRSTSDTELYCYDLLFILKAVLEVWREELAKSGVQIEFKLLTNQRHVNLFYFNLDVVFNNIIANLLKRSYRSQRLTISFEEEEEYLSVTFLDHGSPLPKNLSPISEHVNGTKADLNIEQLPMLMQQNRGLVNVFVSDTQNKVQLLWPIERTAEQKAIAATYEHIESVGTQLSDAGAIPTLTAEEEWMNKINHIVIEHYSNPDFGTTMLAKQLFVSERSLQRRFKSITNRTFKDYLNEVRLEKACEQLLAGGKISDVAYDCGFNDPSYFGQRFKLHFGTSPSKFAGNAES